MQRAPARPPQALPKHFPRHLLDHRERIMRRLMIVVGSTLLGSGLGSLAVVLFGGWGAVAAILVSLVVWVLAFTWFQGYWGWL